MSSDSGGRIVVLLVMGFGYGVFSFYKGLKSFKLKRVLENTPTSKIRSAAVGLVEVCGEAVHYKGLLISPLSQENCVYFRYKVREKRGSGKNSRWVTVSEGKSETCFYIKDDTGQILVNPEGAEVDIPKDFECKSGTFQGDPPDSVKQFLQTNGLSFEWLLGINKTMHFEEYYIAPGDALYILGSAGKNTIDRPAEGTRQEDLLMIQKGQHSPYYISDSPEYKVRDHFKGEIFWGVYGGATLSTFCLGLLLLFFRIL